MRYLLLVMGFFSFFCGLMYNDFTSIPLYIFGKSCYHMEHSGHSHNVTLNDDCVYPAGVDPSWYLGRNELTFMNSLKMKLSVLIGVTQMALGVFLKAMNNYQFKKPVDFIFEFIPQMILLLSLFGFMDLLIVVKWLTDFSGMSGAKPPSIISMMIIFGLSFGVPDPKARETDLLSY
jgi:V-type H+-transporting ATPase subunit a